MIDLPPYLKLESALAAFFNSPAEETTSQDHIKGLHKHIALRLVIEGGFLPEEVEPHPPLRVKFVAGRKELIYDPAAETTSERTVLGGLKSKAIDVVVSKEKVGPVFAVSVKGTGKAYRNLTNRMEEAIGDSTNLHIMYPGLVYGFFHVLRGTTEGTPGLKPNDIAIRSDGTIVQSLRRFHDVLLGLTGRRLVRDDYTRYEAVGCALVCGTPTVGSVHPDFPAPTSPLAVANFFTSLFQVYDLRYPYVGSSMTFLKRHIWYHESPLFEDIASIGTASDVLGYAPRIDEPV